MDFTKLDVGVSAPAKQETAFTVDLPQFKNGNGKPLQVTVLAFTSPEGRKELRKWQLRFGKLTGDHSGASEDELDALADQAQDGDAELIARVVRSWNVEESDGKAVPCTLENRVAFLKAFEPVASALAARVAKLAVDLGKLEARLTDYAAQAGFLRATEGDSTKSRGEILTKAGMPVPMPEADHPIIETLDELGWFYPGPNGPAQLPANEINAWCEGMGDSLTPWEFSMVRRMSGAFCFGVAAKQAPYQPLLVKMGLATASFEGG